MKLIYKISLRLSLIFLLFSCDKIQEPTELKQGIWRGEIDIQGQQLPFNFEVLKKDNTYSINLINSKESISLDEVTVQGDSVFITLHIFDIDIRAKINGDNLSGLYIKNYADDYRLPFKATFGKTTRFDNPQSSNDFDGNWQTLFVEDDGSSYPAVGVFKKEGDILTGTFLTETGDYRYLEGYTKDGKMSLFTFDGNHAFIFNATLKNDSLVGKFYSGKSYNETFTAFKNPDAKLKDAHDLTYLKEGYDKISFSFPGLDGKPVSLEDEKYKGKVVMLQIFGTWCPNCMDETVFYNHWYEKNKDKGVAIIGLAYETKADFNYAKARVEKMKNKYNVGYDYVIAGISNKKEAAKTLPMLNHILSFPTTIFIDRKGKVRRIHTGFSGPATGKYYTEFVEDFNDFMNKLIAEKP